MGAQAAQYFVDLNTVDPQSDVAFDERLSVAIELLRDTGTALVGFDEFGGMIVSVEEVEEPGFLAWLKERRISVSADPPDSWNPIRDLLMEYEGFVPPTPNELASIGFTLKENDTFSSTLTLSVAEGAISGKKIRALESNVEFSFLSTAARFRAVRDIEEKDFDLSLLERACPEPRPVNDPDWCDQWGLRSIYPERAWTRTRGDTVVVAVVDTGVNYRHPDLADNMWSSPSGHHGRDFVDNDFCPEDENGHGTQIAAIIGAIADNHKGITGVAPEVKIMAVRWMDANERGGPVDAAQAIKYAIDNGASVINASWFIPSHHKQVERQIRRAREKNILFIAAAGGTDIDPKDAPERYPAAYTFENIVSVLGTDGNGDLISASGYGHESVDLGAPGLSILTATSAGGYNRFSGSSMAAAFVSGAAALMRSKNSTQSYESIKSALLAGVRPVANLSEKCVSSGTLCLDFLTGAGAQNCRDN